TEMLLPMTNSLLSPTGTARPFVLVCICRGCRTCLGWTCVWKAFTRMFLLAAQLEAVFFIPMLASITATPAMACCWEAGLDATARERKHGSIIGLTNEIGSSSPFGI